MTTFGNTTSTEDGKSSVAGGPVGAGQGGRRPRLPRYARQNIVPLPVACRICPTSKKPAPNCWAASSDASQQPTNILRSSSHLRPSRRRARRTVVCLPLHCLAFAVDSTSQQPATRACSGSPATLRATCRRSG